MTNTFVDNFHADALQSFRNYKRMAERAVEQVSDEEFFALIDAEANSIAVVVKHIAGNAYSRWRDFLTTDGEKADRQRDTEFEATVDTRGSLMQFWEQGWQTLFDNLEPLKAEDFGRSVTIRGEPHTVVEAVNRQLTHYAYHVGQIVLLAKHFRSAEWKTLSVPKNRSAEFNQFLGDKQAAGEAKSDRLEHRSNLLTKKEKRLPNGSLFTLDRFGRLTAAVAVVTPTVVVPAVVNANTRDDPGDCAAVRQVTRLNGLAIPSDDTGRSDDANAAVITPVAVDDLNSGLRSRHRVRPGFCLGSGWSHNGDST
jgi:uncharacterized damage-inducible protein DinB